MASRIDPEHICFPGQPRRKSSSMVDRRWTSWLIPVICMANVAVFIVVMYINNCPKNNTFGQGKCVPMFLGRFSFQPLRQNISLGPSTYTLLKMGALQWDMVVHLHQGWRLITCIWLHGGLIHLLCNIFGLLYIGIRLEQKFGFVRIGVLYLVSGVGGSVLSALFLEGHFSMGASGAVFGLLGAMLSELLVNWTIYNNKVVVLLELVLLLIVPNLALGIIPFLHVDNFGHLGGFMTGFLLGFVVLLRPRFGWQERHQLPEHLRVKSKYLPYQLVLFVIALALLIAGYTVGMIMLFKGKKGNDFCKWCHYLTCVAFSRWKCN